MVWVQQFEATLAPASHRLNNRPFGDAGAIATTDAAVVAIAAILSVLFFPLAGLAVGRYGRRDVPIVSLCAAVPLAR
jgi:MFS family permease